jgi:ABC-type Fe3+ transport system permease subunit
VVAGLWSWLSVVGEMTVTDLYRVRTYAEELYTGFALGDGLADSAAAVWPGLALTATMAAVAWLVAQSLAPGDRTALRRPFVYPLGPGRWLGAACLAGVLLLVVGVPLGNLLYKAGLELRDLGATRVRAWSAVVLAMNLLAVPGRYGDSFGWSALVAGLAATLAVPGAVALAWPARRGGWKGLPALLVTALGLAVPAPLVGLALIRLLDQPGWPGLVWLYDETVLAPVLAMLIRTLPSAILFCWYALRTIGEDVLDSGACDGAGPWRRLWWIVLPQRRAALAAAWLFAFCLASGELAASILVAPPGVSTLPIRVFGLIHAGVDDQVAALCLFAWLGVCTAVGVLLWLVKMRKGWLY